MCFGDDDNSTTTTTSLPEWYSQAGENTFDFAQTVSNQPYTPYAQPRVAGFSDLQDQGFGTVEEGQGIWQPALKRAEYYTRNVGNNQYAPGTVDTGSFDTAAAQQYMNPFVDQVLDTTLARYDEQALAARNNLQGQAALSGAFGGGRHGVAEAEFDRGALEDRARIAAGLYSDAYNNAANIFASDQARQLEAQRLNEAFAQQGYDMSQRYRLGAGEQLAGLGQLRSGLNYADAQALMNAGGLQQTLQQMGLDVEYGDFLEQRDWPLRQLNILTGALSATPVNSTTTTEGPSGSNTGQLIGALGAGIGAGLSYF